METSQPAATTVEYPSLSDRIQSSFIDAIFIVIMMLLFARFLPDDAPGWVRALLFFGLWAVYEPLCTSLGGTIGNLVKGIRVRDFSDPSKRINIFFAFFRYVIKVGLSWISFITINFNPEKRAIHDFVGGSVMIKKGA